MSPRPEAGCTGLEHEECRALLAAHDFGRLALVTTSGQPLIRPINIAAGTCEHVTRPQETAALDALDVPHHPALRRPEWFRLRATRLTGRRVPPLPAPAGP